MKFDEVKRLVGAPDDIRTERDPGGLTALRTKEVWRYGTDRHLSFATLGTVHVQPDGRVQYVFGGRGTPPAGFDEAELRRLMTLLNAVPSYNQPLDPLALIRAVNALHALGKERALAVVDEYLRVASTFEDESGAEGLFLVMRVLFDVPRAGVMPEMFVGGPDRQPPRDRKALPRWPLTITDDIPLKLVRGYGLAGMAQNPVDDVAWFRTNGVLRAGPLRPPPSPLETVDRYMEQTLIKVMSVDDDLRIYLYDQALRLVATVQRPTATVDGWFPYGPKVRERWVTARADIAKLAPRWSEAARQYVRSDGSFISLTPTRTWQRVWWDLPIAGAQNARLTFERKSDDRVDGNLFLELADMHALVPGTLRMSDAVTGAILTELPVDGVTEVRGSVIGRSNIAPTSIDIIRQLMLPARHAIRAEWVDANGKRSRLDLVP